jgi:lipopolysaccharide export system protein LptC
VPTWTPELHLRQTHGSAVLALSALLAGALPSAATAVDDGATLVVERFELRITDKAGEVTHVLRGERMEQFEVLGFQRVERPRLELLANGAVDWIWTAPVAVHYPAQHRLELLGVTKGLRPPGGPNVQTEIETFDVTIATDSQEVTTDARATLTQPGLNMTGIGMHADPRADIVELYSDVITVYSSEHEQERKND